MRLFAMTLFAILVPTTGAGQETDMTGIVDFSDPGGASWTIVNDGVMGGRSSSDLELTDDGTAVFSGSVSLANNGGFASVRARFRSLDLSALEGVVLRVRGDGRRYDLRFRMDGGFAGEWTEIRLPFVGFQPSFRGWVPPGSGPLDPSRIRQMGILIGDKKEGPFRLEIEWIRGYRDPGSHPAP
jgi:monofunctional biosynthetic peptidoglycan transglycosylase